MYWKQHTELHGSGYKNWCKKQAQVTPEFKLD